MANFTLGGLAAHLAAALIQLPAAEQRALEQAALLIETEAKAELGNYQSAAAPFAGWAELADSTKDNRVKQGFTENDPGLASGEMRDSIGHVVGNREAVVGSNDEKLVWFEMGTAKQPPRSVLGIAAVHEGPAVAAIFAGGVVKTLVGRDVFPGGIPIP